MRLNFVERAVKGPNVFVAARLRCRPTTSSSAWAEVWASENLVAGAPLQVSLDRAVTVRSWPRDTYGCEVLVKASTYGDTRSPLYLGTSSRYEVSDPMPAWINQLMLEKEHKSSEVFNLDGRRYQSPAENQFTSQLGEGSDVMLRRPYEAYRTTPATFELTGWDPSSGGQSSSVTLIASHRLTACVYGSDLASTCEGLSISSSPTWLRVRVFARWTKQDGTACTGARQVFDQTMALTQAKHHLMVPVRAIITTNGLPEGCTAKLTSWTVIQRVDGAIVAVHRPASRQFLVPGALPG
ncbi:hypothetical protein ACSDQ9_06250 [Aestuariimicrobium soli]|uniref:hypothetical protein n=1 Tax=Aestuariimicrobium soli TaxID=2035834 RepID=UPI003EB7FFBC